MLATCPAVQFRNPERAVELAKSALQREPKIWTHWALFGIAQYRVDEVAVAIESLEKLRSLAGEGDGLHFFLLAMAHWRLGDEKQARAWQQRALNWMQEKHPSRA